MAFQVIEEDSAHGICQVGKMFFVHLHLECESLQTAA